jgi:hypothetical protein
VSPLSTFPCRSGANIDVCRVTAVHPLGSSFHVMVNAALACYRGHLAVCGLLLIINARFMISSRICPYTVYLIAVGWGTRCVRERSSV